MFIVGLEQTGTSIHLYSCNDDYYYMIAFIKMTLIIVMDVMMMLLDNDW